MVNGYQLLDSGNRKRLERFGDFTFVRPEPKALWKATLPQHEWQNADAFYHRSEKGGGFWKYKTTLPESWNLQWNSIQFKIRPTQFKHMGLFPEHEVIWDYIQNQLKRAEPGSVPHVLNLFGYTGASTLAAAAAGARVTHVDGSKGTIAWARENAQLSNLGNRPIRWIPEDVMTYCKREQKRGTKYEGIIMDAPAFGRGTKGEVWKFEDDVPYLVELCKDLLSDKPLFIVLVSYATEYSSLVLKQLLQQHFIQAKVETKELTIVQESNGFVLPLAASALAEF